MMPSTDLCNDTTERPHLWRRYPGDDWAAFDALPPAIRRRIAEQAYDVWSVNALKLWRRLRQRSGSARAERSMLRHIDLWERLEADDFAAAHQARWGASLPHAAAAVSVLRYGPASACHPPRPPSGARPP